MKKNKVSKSPATLVLLHSLWVVLIAVNAFTGLRIQSDQQGSTLELIRLSLPQGSVWFWHVSSGVILVGLFIAYLWYFLARKRAITSRTVSNNRLHSLAYGTLVILVLGSLTTGALNLIDVKSETNTLIHRTMAYGYLLFIALHVFSHAKQSGIKQLLKVIRPSRRVKFLFSSIGIALLSVVLVTVWLLNNAQPLHVAFTHTPISIDGRDDEASWESARAVHITTKHGANLHNGQSDVWVKALYDANNIYLHLKWQDPTRSQKHLPLVKTEEGWKILQTQFDVADENEFYEDKFAVLLANGDALASSKSIHLGQSPLKDQPDSLNGRGLHYTTNGKIYDLWHWQSVRSNIHYQADDSYFGPATPAPKGFPKTREERKNGTYERYTAGYRKDPPESWHGVNLNWETFNKDITQPRRLPIEQENIRNIKNNSTFPDISDTGDWWFTWDDTRPYVSAQDNLPIGTLLPSVLLISKRPEDRGDITAHGYWKNGHWHLEMKRALSTGSPYDVPINNNTYLWFAIFDHTQTRHSRHLRPIKLNLSERL